MGWKTGYGKLVIPKHLLSAAKWDHVEGIPPPQKNLAFNCNNYFYTRWNTWLAFSTSLARKYKYLTSQGSILVLQNDTVYCVHYSV